METTSKLGKPLFSALHPPLHPKELTCQRPPAANRDKPVSPIAGSMVGTLATLESRGRRSADYPLRDSCIAPHRGPVDAAQSSPVRELPPLGGYSSVPMVLHAKTSPQGDAS
jgi:hypothetical protein